MLIRSQDTGRCCILEFEIQPQLNSFYSVVAYVPLVFRENCWPIIASRGLERAQFGPPTVDHLESQMGNQRVMRFTNYVTQFTC